MWCLYIKSGTELPDLDDGCPYDFTKLEAAEWFQEEYPTALREFTVENIANLLDEED